MRGHDLFRIAAIFSAVLCYSTILLGGTVMASGDGLGCPHWPTCYGNDDFLPGVAGPAAVEWSHRVVAFVLSVAVLALAVLGGLFERNRPALLRLALGSLGLVVLEAVLGGVVVESDLRPEFVIFHLGIATVLFGLLLMLVLLSNLRELPRRWIEWARRASDATPASPRPATEPPRPSDRRSPYPLPGDG